MAAGKFLVAHAVQVAGADCHDTGLQGGLDRAEAVGWRPYVETAIEAFGSSRCMFEGNFLVDRAVCSYGVLWNGYKHITAGYSADERANLFSRTARAVYKI